MTTKCLLVCDLDDTLFNTVSEALQVVYKKTNKVIAYDSIETYDISQHIAPVLGLTLSETRTFMEKVWSNPAVYRNARPVYEVWSILKNIQQEPNVTLVFLTSRPVHLAEMTRKQVDNAGFSDKEIIFGSMTEKANIIEQLYNTGDYDNVAVLDDCKDIAKDIEERGFYFFGMIRPWCYPCTCSTLIQY